MVKINKMIEKKTGGGGGGMFLVIYVIYGRLVYTDSKKKSVLFTPPTAGFIPYMQLLKCKLVRIQGGLCLFQYVLNNRNWVIFVCFVQFSN